MKIQLRSLAALAILTLILNSCNTSSRQSQLNTDIDQERASQAEGDFTEDSQDLSTPPLELTVGGQVHDDETSTAQEMAGWPDGQVRIDQQNEVEVAMVPVNLNNAQETLDFEVSLNTHSIDLSMDLAALTSLRTDSGFEVKASGWSGLSGGHHVNGILSFPSTKDGDAVLKDAEVLELTVINLDAPERVFIWER